MRVEERERPTLVRGVDGRPVYSTAIFEVDPLSGAILAYDVTVGREDALTLSCRFARHEAFDLYLPARLEERFTDAGRALFGVSTYTNWRKFEVASRIVP